MTDRVIKLMDGQMLSQDRDWGVLAASDARRIAQVILTNESACPESINLERKVSSTLNPLVSFGCILE